MATVLGNGRFRKCPFRGRHAQYRKNKGFLDGEGLPNRTQPRIADEPVGDGPDHHEVVACPKMASSLDENRLA